MNRAGQAAWASGGFALGCAGYCRFQGRAGSSVLMVEACCCTYLHVDVGHGALQHAGICEHIPGEYYTWGRVSQVHVGVRAASHQNWVAFRIFRSTSGPFHKESEDRFKHQS